MTTTTALRHPRSDYATAVVGTADQLANLITHHRTAGTLIAVGRPVPVPNRPGHYQIRLRISATVAARLAGTHTQPAITTPATRHRRLRRHRQARIAVIATVAAGTIAALAAAAAYLLGQLVELITAHLATVLGVCALAVLLLAALGRAGACPGIHCPGCHH